MRSRTKTGNGIASRASLAWLLRFALVMAFYGAPASAVVDAKLEPTEIEVGQSAELTVKISGLGDQSVNLPSVPGLQFRIVGQSRSIQMTNGATLSSVSTIVRVIAAAPGTYVIPGLTPPSQPLILRVRPAGAPPSAPAPGYPGSGPNASGSSVHMSPDGSAFVRLGLPKHDVYVGESVPVDIEVGMRAGFVSSLNGLPTFKGGDFTLNNLSHQPERVERVIDGKPFEVFIWHSVLAAVKPGDFSLSVETPLTVRIRKESPRESRLEDLLGDPFLQNIFGATVQKDITVSSPSTQFKVLALPTDNRPTDFSGAIGVFKITDELSANKGMAGDPLMLKMRVSGTGNFDRVNSSMLENVDGWKTYPPKSSFAAGDAVGYKGEKTFEQPVIPVDPGTKALPPLSFSFFNPNTRQYETAHSAPLSVDISGATAPTVAAAPASADGKIAAAPAAPKGPAGLRPNHAADTAGDTTLLPLYLRPMYLTVAGVMLLAFVGGWLTQLRNARVRARRLHRSLSAQEHMQRLQAAAAERDAPKFLRMARATLLQALAAQWNTPTDALSEADIDRRLGAEGADIRRVLALADEANYSGHAPADMDFAAMIDLVRARLEAPEPGVPI